MRPANFLAAIGGDRLARGFSMLVAGTACAHLITLGASPLLTRVYDPGDFGLLAIYASVISLFTVVVNLNYETAIPMSDDTSEGANLVALSAVIGLGMTCASGLGVYLFGPELCSLIGVPQFAPWLWLIPPAVLFSAIYQPLYYVAVRERAFGIQSRTTFARSLTMIIVQLATFKLGSVGLLLGQLASQSAGLTSLAVFSRKVFSSDIRRVSRSQMWKQALRYRELFIWGSWGRLFNAMGAQLPNILFAAFFSPAAAGVYLLTTRILYMPIVLASQAVGDVFFSEAPRALRANRLPALVLRATRVLVTLSMAPLGVLAIASPRLFPMVFGENWSAAGSLVTWFTPCFFLIFVTSPLSRLTVVLQKNFMGFVFQATLVVCRLGAIALAYWITRDFMLTAGALAVVSAIVYALYAIWCFWVAGVPARQAGDALARPIVGAIAVWSPVLLALFWPGTLFLTIAVCVSVVIYFIHLYRVLPSLTKSDVDGED